MKKKYEIIDLSNNPQGLQPGDMVKLKKWLRVGRKYAGVYFYRGMRFKYYKVVHGISMSGSASIELPISNGALEPWYFPKVMLDLTCVKRRVTDDDKC